MEVFAYVLLALVYGLMFGRVIMRGAHLRAHPLTGTHSPRSRQIALAIGFILLVFDVVMLSISRHVSVGEVLFLFGMTAYVSGYMYWRAGGFTRSDRQH